ncbi:SunI/YnzG family protein [Domibacillus epiphyticus]|uniref:Sublancin immunity protein SunI-like PH domain-containing protein n=1 Tax=Domibacillus epiphyticus TaxID=1714355 RepID=A0A1V2A7M3_9BACI|nr:hypothetical protein [Domibacillus epiphyticus]OMP66930.1 hypothetical protein BTO28_10000 [Domibacillus epiphyticus]
MIYFAAVVVIVVAGVFLANRYFSGHKVEEGLLVVKSGDKETAIPMDEIVEVFEMDEFPSEPSLIEKYIIRPYVKKERVAVLTSSNISYLFVLRNPDRLVKSVKAQNPGVHIKAKVI